MLIYTYFVCLGTQIQGLSAAVIGYQQAMKENRDLYNLLQELRGLLFFPFLVTLRGGKKVTSLTIYSPGNIRVFCRIRPSFQVGAKSSIDYVGNDGSLMILDPLKAQITRKIFQFNKVLGPNISQG